MLERTKEHMLSLKKYEELSNLYYKGFCFEKTSRLTLKFYFYELNHTAIILALKNKEI